MQTTIARFIFMTPSTILLTIINNQTTIDDYDEDDLIACLRELDDIYSNSPEVIDEFDLTDTKYDNLYASVKRLYPSNEYFLGVGSASRTGKVDLPYQMGSLNQLYSNEDLQKWISEHNLEDAELVISAKYDGNACEAIFNQNGKLQISFSRGDGFQGADTTRHINHVMSKYVIDIATIRQKISHLNNASTVDLRGEVICRKSLFESNRTSMDGYIFKNPRNMVAGLMNKDKSDISILTNLTFVPFNIDSVSGQMNKKDQLDLLKEAGFTSVRYVVKKGKDVNSTVLIDIMRTFKQEEDYELDGVVIEVNDAVLRSQIEPKNDSLNPEYAIKFKENAAAVSVTVSHIEWNVSKHGYLKPTVVYEPVQIQGVTCSRATGFNAGFINQNKIGKGAVISIVRSGDVIPHITSVVTPSYAELPDVNVVGKYHWTVNDNDEQVDIVLDDLPTEAKLLQVVHFAQTLKIPLLSEGNVKKVNEVMGYVDIIDFVKMSESNWVYAIGSNGEKIYNSMQEIFANVEDTKLAAAIGCFGRGVGYRKLKKITRDIGKNVAEITPINILKAAGVGNVTYDLIIDNLGKYKQFVADVEGYINVVSGINTQGKFSGISIVFTGFRDADLQTYIEKRGGDVKSSVSKKTNIVVTNDVNGKSSKLDKARELIKEGFKIDLLTVEEFKTKYIKVV